MAGQPLKFKTVEELQEKIDKYFASCDENEEPISITGLALALDTSRETLCNYENKDGYFDTVKRAKLRVEHAYEKRLIKRGNGGDIFALKNFGWKDESKVENNFVGNVPLVLRELKNDKSDGNSSAVSTSDKSEEEE